MKIVYYEPVYSATKNYYVVIINDEQLWYNPSTNIYEAYVSHPTHAITLTRSANIILSADLGEQFDTVRGTALLFERAGANPALADLIIHQHQFYYRPDFLNVISEQEILNYSERLLPLLNGASSAGIQVLAPVTQSVLSEANLLAEIKTISETPSASIAVPPEGEV